METAAISGSRTPAPKPVSLGGLLVLDLQPPEKFRIHTLTKHCRYHRGRGAWCALGVVPTAGAAAAVVAVLVS